MFSLAIGQSQEGVTRIAQKRFGMRSAQDLFPSHLPVWNLSVLWSRADRNRFSQYSETHPRSLGGPRPPRTCPRPPDEYRWDCHCESDYSHLGFWSLQNKPDLMALLFSHQGDLGVIRPVCASLKHREIQKLGGWVSWSLRRIVGRGAIRSVWWLDRAFHQWGHGSECATTKNAREENVGEVGSAGHGHGQNADWPGWVANGHGNPQSSCTCTEYGVQHTEYDEVLSTVWGVPTSPDNSGESWDGIVLMDWKYAQALVTAECQ